MKKLLNIIGIFAAITLLAATMIYFYLLKDSEDYEKSLGVNRTLQNMNDATVSTTENSPAITTSTADTAAPAVSGAGSELSNIAADMDSVTVDPTGVIYMLFLGTDRTEERDRTLGIYRTDTICLARIDLIGKKVKLLSIPRDTYTYLPVVNRKDRINAAYAYGSKKGTAVQAAIDALETFMGRPAVDYYFLIDMEPIPEIVDSLGGVMLDVEIDMKTHGASLSKGLQFLDGKKAFEYINWRYSGMGDIDRIKRQQKFAKALYQKIIDEEKLVNAAELVLKYNKNIKTSLTPKQLISFARLCSEIPADDVSYVIIPGNGRTIDKKSVWVPDEVGTKAVLKEFFSN